MSVICFCGSYEHEPWQHPRNDEPTTAAGKRWMETPAAQVVTGMADAVLDIEAEAREQERSLYSSLVAEAFENGRAAALARVRERVEKHLAHHSHEPGKNCVSAFCAAGLHRAVLAIIDEESALGGATAAGGGAILEVRKEHE